MNLDKIEAERQRRLELWRTLHRRDGPDRVKPSLVKELRLHRGQQGIYRDQKLTGPLTSTGTGVAVGLLHTGSSYSDDLFDDGVIYHYPVTSRGQRDRNEIASMKACAEHSLPVFVVIKRSPADSTRDVRLGWVTDHDDGSRQLLISFLEAPPSVVDVQTDEDDKSFELKKPRADRRTSTRARLGQCRFRFRVFKRYGSVCAFCQITEPKLLQAAHLCPVEEGGSDDPRNGLVMCLTHHKAFDDGLLLIEPESLELCAGPSVPDLKTIGVTNNIIVHLRHKPHREALLWAWSKRASGHRVRDAAQKRHAVGGAAHSL
jgi:hypothetical protein